MTALIVCSRFSAWSNTIDAGDSNTSSVDLGAVEAELLVQAAARASVERVVDRGQAVHELGVGLPVARISSAVTR